MKIVVGLGNPGDQYAKTRHNVGWMVLDEIADRAGWSGRGKKSDRASIAGGRYRGLDLTIVKPMTWMNDSGLAVRKILARERSSTSSATSSSAGCGSESGRRIAGSSTMSWRRSSPTSASDCRR